MLRISLFLLAAVVTQGMAVQIPGNRPLRIIAFGAHPDDAELKFGGTATLFAAQGHKVKLVALTNGDVGHFSQAGGPLAQRPTGQGKKSPAHLGRAPTEERRMLGSRYRSRMY